MYSFNLPFSLKNSFHCINQYQVVLNYYQIIILHYSVPEVLAIFWASVGSVTVLLSPKAEYLVKQKRVLLAPAFQFHLQSWAIAVLRGRN